MVRSSLITRLADGLPLAASMDDQQTETQLRDAKNQAKQLLPNSRHSVPAQFGFEFLSELAKEFFLQHGHDVPSAVRPYAFVKFDTFIQKLKRQYQDTRNPPSHLQRLNEDLQDVTRIMTKNMEDLLYRGDTLDRMGTMSEALRESSLKYRKDARKLRLEAMYRTYGPPAVVLLVILLVLYFRYF
ncbi:hypothetical protein BCR44DRAFT_1492395 [Catenaria anguillulae PL171]|uniref:Protein transport protein SEC22 n=1 Tax=Catenaria anguillulae PL171 TaxID=765915 RepID=A0A1Y2I1Q0_9FUNG|nr:hypothetical protein BCR44DRAFT_1492395 [Catenaria anguillulae PL171]